MVCWEELEQACGQCNRCGLCENRTHVVFGTGVKNADLMLIGEGPGENEDLEGLPFVGKAGQLLDDMLEIIDLYRDKNVYIANVVKCRPPQNRDPASSEQEACLPWLRRQFSLVQPKMVVCLGRIAACAIIKPDFKITKEHGLLFEKKGTYFTALYHPAALLRDPSKKPDTFMDLKQLQKNIQAYCPQVYEKDYLAAEKEEACHE